MKYPTQTPILTDRFTRAVDYARTLHTETRKGTKIPYMAHLLGVASLVMGEAGGAGSRHRRHGHRGHLCTTPSKTTAASARSTRWKRNSAPTSRAWWMACPTLSPRITTRKKAGKQRKKAYLARLRTEPEDVLLISAADKLYNAKAILDDLKEIGPAVWDRFKRGPKDQLWYFHSLLEIFEPRLHSRMVGELKRVVDEIAYLVATGWPGEKAAPEPREI